MKRDGLRIASFIGTVGIKWWKVRLLRMSRERVMRERPLRSGTRQDLEDVPKALRLRGEGMKHARIRSNGMTAMERER
jgi:hypothetical protein